MGPAEIAIRFMAGPEHGHGVFLTPPAQQAYHLPAAETVKAGQGIETPDGTVYPDGLREKEIPLLSRILHVADTFDALTSDRSYRRGFPLAKALDIMRKDTGTKLDPEAVEAFERALERFRTKEPKRFRELFGHVKESE